MGNNQSGDSGGGETPRTQRRVQTQPPGGCTARKRHASTVDDIIRNLHEMEDSRRSESPSPSLDVMVDGEFAMDSSSTTPHGFGQPIKIEYDRPVFGLDSLCNSPAIGSSGSDRQDFPVAITWRSSSQSPAENVCVCGSWDNWKAQIPLVRSSGKLAASPEKIGSGKGKRTDFTTILNLSPGVHDFKFVVDGKWVIDASRPQREGDTGTNNFIEVDRNDFEVFPALLKDEEECKRKKRTRTLSTIDDFSTDLSHIPFTHEIPDPDEHFRGADSTPPCLAPSCLQATLNVDVSGDCNQMMAEPTPGMLNRLYAHPIEGEVIVLSTTSRFRKKYVTTVLYKPL